MFMNYVLRTLGMTVAASAAGCSDNPNTHERGLACFSAFWLESIFAENSSSTGKKTLLYADALVAFCVI